MLIISLIQSLFLQRIQATSIMAFRYKPVDVIAEMVTCMMDKTVARTTLSTSWWSLWLSIEVSVPSPSGYKDMKLYLYKIYSRQAN